MYRLDSKEYKVLLESYQTCLARFFPDMKMECLTETFMIDDRNLPYNDIAGVLVIDSHLIVEIKDSYLLYLPICENGEYCVRKFSAEDQQALLNLRKKSTDN